MTLYRLKLRPRSPWRTPWQADTLTGMLLATCARVHGPDVLRDRLIEPMLAGKPPFVLSDAMPGDLLPMPIVLRLADWPHNTDRKTLKRARWLTVQAFQLARTGTVPPFDQLLADDALFLDHARHHNTLSRLTNTTGDAAGLAPFSRPETLLRDDPPGHHDAGFLSVYFRILDITGVDAANLFLDLFHELSLTGFGADVATGRGQFDIVADPQPMPELDTSPSGGANGVVTFSTFQPGPDDPTDGYWDAFPKFGKFGPDLGITDVRKNTLILFRPGACFRMDASQPFQRRGFRGWLGRAVPMNELIPPNTVAELARRGFNIIHPAFALTTPVTLPTE